MKERSAPSPSKQGPAAWALYDWANSPFATIIQTFVFPAYFIHRIAQDAALGSALWGTTLSLAGLAMALAGPVLGAIADQSGRRKPWIAAGTLLCVAATAGLWAVCSFGTSSLWLVLGLVALGTAGTEAAQIFYNAMLPELIPASRIGRWSGWGWAAGYAGGLACLGLVLVGLKGGIRVEASFLLVAVWYLVFAVPLLRWTPDAPATGKSWRAAIGDGVAQLAGSIRQARRHSQIIRFLIARMLYVDGLATLFAFGGIYAAGTFGMGEQQVVRFGLSLNVAAALGAVGFGWVDDHLGSYRTILLSLGCLVLAVAGALMVRSPQGLLLAGLVVGVFVGPVQAASRSFMARLAPPALRNEMFGLFALSGRLTAFLGPLGVGWVTHWSGSQRLGMSLILVLLLAGFGLMLTVPAKAEG
jgi:UMF1 family MFS transporter